MMNYLWGGMLLIGILYASFTGNMQAVTEAVISSSKEAITLSITMLGIVSFWNGLMQIAISAGIMDNITRLLSPVMHFLFPDIPKKHPSLASISTNFVANILGLGWAATPAGLRAMEDLASLELQRNNPGYTQNIPDKRTASNEMCTFLVMNISSLQLIPVNIIAYRSQYGSVNPAGIIGPSLIATTVSTLVAVIYCKIMCICHRV